MQVLTDAPDSFAGNSIDFDYGFDRYAIPRAPGNPNKSLFNKPYTARASSYNRASPSPGAPQTSQAPSSSTSPQLHKGDTVDHAAFGRGTVISVSPTGGDALLEIAFETEGTKRMLINSAARYITKV